MKKKKKKKTAFDLDGAMAAEADEQVETQQLEEAKPVDDLIDEDLDLEDFGKKKKKKKKKPFNEADLEFQAEDGEEPESTADKADDDLDLDFATSKKKKRSKKKDLNDILDQDDAKDEDKENGK